MPDMCSIECPFTGSLNFYKFMLKNEKVHESYVEWLYTGTGLLVVQVVLLYAAIWRECCCHTEWTVYNT